jgi:CHAT domain
MSRFDALSNLPRPLPASLVLVPGHTVPIQPLLIRELGHAAVLNVSMKEPAPPRPIHRAALFGEDGERSFSSLLEIRAIEALLRSRGVDVTRFSSTAEEFKKAYADPAFDLIWVAGHGEHRAYRLEESAVVLGDKQAILLDDLAVLEAPAGSRRALVLNICSGGMSATLGGPLGLGLGPVLAGPTQSVFTHLWPVEWQFAAAFGGLLILELTKGLDHLAAYAAAIETLLRGREATATALGEAPELTVIADRLSDHVDLSNVLSWGAPVLLT